MSQASNPYLSAQQGLALLKAAVVMLLGKHYPEGLKNSQLGRALGIYMGHIGHEGHISRTVLTILEGEMIVQQDPDSKSWKLTENGSILFATEKQL
jgi:hypothetical protein